MASTSNCNKTTDFLKAGNYLNVDIFALQTADGKIIAPLGSVPFTPQAE